MGWRKPLLITVILAAAALAVWLSVGLRNARVPVGRGGPMGVLVDMVDDVQDAAQKAVETRSDDEDEVSPFEDVEWTAQRTPRVMVNGAWYELVSLDGWPVDEMLAFIDKEFGTSRREKRFEEDLGLTLDQAGRKVGKNALLRLRPAGGGDEVEILAPMTEENRLRIWKKRAAATPIPGGGLQAPGGQPMPGASQYVTANTLQEFASLLAEKHSYTIAMGKAAAVRERVEAFIAQHPNAEGQAIVQEVSRLVGATIDGHAGVESRLWSAERGPWVPALFCPLKDEPGTGVVGVMPDRSAFLDPERPFVMAVNGAGIEELITRAGEYVPDGSNALVRERSCRLLRAAWMSGAHDLKSVSLMVAATPHTPSSGWKALSLDLSTSKPFYGEWPRRGSGFLEVQGEKIGYLRLASMESGEAVDEAMEWIEKFEDCDGLIIDVRGNGGGSREALLKIAARVMPAPQKSVVFNAARPLLLGDDDQGLNQRMSRRFMVPAEAARSAAAQSIIVKADAGSNAAGLALSSGRFADWYIGEVHAEEPRAWDAPVIVLMDNGCFSATDIFLLAMSELDNTTLVGRPSAGGSGMAVTYPLAAGAVQVRLSSMVSFGPDGQLIDGRGVQPDAVVWPEPTDFVLGGTDAVLDAAVHTLGESK